MPNLVQQYRHRKYRCPRCGKYDVLYHTVTVHTIADDDENEFEVKATDCMRCINSVHYGLYERDATRKLLHKTITPVSCKAEVPETSQPQLACRDRRNYG